MISWLFIKRIRNGYDSKLTRFNSFQSNSESTNYPIIPNINVENNSEQKFNSNCFVNYQIKLYVYERNEINPENKAVTLLNINNQNIIYKYLKLGFEISAKDVSHSNYIITTVKSNINNFHFSNITKFHDKVSINSKSSIYCNQKMPIKSIQYIKYVISPILIIFIMLSLFFKITPLADKYISSPDFTFFYMTKQGHVLTPLSRKLPKSVKRFVKNIKEFPKSEGTIHEIYTNDNQEIYQIILQNVSDNIVQCSILRSSIERNDIDCEMRDDGVVYTIDDTDERYMTDAKLTFKSDGPHSITVDLNIEQKPVSIKIDPKDIFDISLGRQSNEISKFIEIQLSLFRQGIASKPNRSNFINFLQTAKSKLDYKGLALFIMEGPNKATIIKFCDNNEIKERVTQFEQDFYDEKIQTDDVSKFNIGAYRYGVHTISIQRSRYLIVLVIDSKTNIMRSLEFNFHAILSMLVTYNHNKLNKYISEGHNLRAERIWFKNITVAEYEEDKYSWSVGNLYGTPITKEEADEIYMRTGEAMKDMESPYKAFVVPMWETPSSRRILEIASKYTVCKISNKKVVTFIARDVTDIYGDGIYNNSQLQTRVLGAVMLHATRVSGKDLNLEVRNTSKSFLGEIPAASFSSLTFITDSKILKEFSTKIHKTIRLIKKRGDSVVASTIPLGEDGDFLILPQKTYGKALTNIKMYKQNANNNEKISLRSMSRRKYSDVKSDDETNKHFSWIVDSAEEEVQHRLNMSNGNFIRNNNSTVGFNSQFSSGDIIDGKNEVRVSLMDLSQDTFFDINIALKKRKNNKPDIPELSYSPRCEKHLQMITGPIYIRDINNFYKCVSDAFKYGHSAILINMHERSSVRPFLIYAEHNHDVLSIVMLSIEDENYIANKASAVMVAMDAVNPTHHIFPWRFQFIETTDCIYSVTPSGPHPAMFSKSSMVHMVFDDQRRHLVASLESGYVDMFILIKYEEARWYILRGQRVGDEIHGMNVLAPYGSIPIFLKPETIRKFANSLLKKFKDLSEKISFDIHEFEESIHKLC